MQPTDPTSYLSDPSLTTAQNNYTNAQNQATTDTAQAITLPDLLQKTLNDKFTTNNPLVATRQGQLSDYLNTLTQAPLNYTAKSGGGNSDVIYSPLQQENLINGARTAALAPLSSTNWLLAQNTGGIQNIIDASSRAAQAEAATAQGRATVAQNTFQNLLAKLKAQSDAAATQQAFNEGVREYNNPQPSKSSGDNGLGASDTASLLALLGLGGNNNSNGVPSSFVPSQPGAVTNSAGKQLYGPGF